MARLLGRYAPSTVRQIRHTSKLVCSHPSSHDEGNKLLWPRGFDHFYGRLSVSPDRTRFMIAGWVPEDVWRIRPCHADGSGLAATIVLDQPLNLARATLAYQAGRDRFVAFSDTLGLAVIGRDGHIELREPAFSPDSYDQTSQQFISHAGTRITLHTIAWPVQRCDGRCCSVPQ